MKLSTFSTPETRAEFEQRMHFLREQLDEGKMKFSSNVTHVVDRLQKVRALPNGRIDLLSIDESARLTANMTYEMFMSNKFGGFDVNNDGETS